MYVLKDAKIFDGVSEKLLEGCSVLIDGGKIQSVKEQDATEYESLDSIDLGGRVVMPGFIDCHMHILQSEVPEPEKLMNDRTPGGDRLENTDAYACFKGVYACRRVLEAGFTTVFDGGGNNYMDFALRECLKTGLFDGPNYYVCGKQITTGRGHLPGIGYEANGIEGMRNAVRAMLWWGADHIKIKMSAPMRIPGRNTERSEYLVEEIHAACEEAHSAGLLVSAHCRGASPIKDFLNGGGDRVVHGTGIDEEGIEMLIKKGLYVYPTLGSPYKTVSQALVNVKSGSAVESLRVKGIQHFESVKRMYEAGVKFGFSTDTGGMAIWPGDNCNEMFYMQEIGMRNIEILRSATSEAAKATGIESSVGFVKNGYRADLIVLEENPIHDLEQVRNVKMVIKGGKIIHNKLPVAIPF